MPRPRKAALTQAELARKYGVAEKTLHEWKNAEGLDLADESAVAERAKIANERKAAKAAKSEDEREAKLRKLSAEADMIEHKLAVQRGEYVASHEMKAEGMRIGGVVRSIFSRMPDDLAPTLAGRTAAEIKKALTAYTRAKLFELAAYKSPVVFDE